MLSLALLPATSLAADAPPTGFGRWETTLRRCQVAQQNSATVSPYQGSCLNLRLNQNIEGLLTVRFLINTDRSGREASGQMTFAGLLWHQDQPMQCSQGQCKPQWPMRVQVHTVASSAIGHGAFASQLPQARLARGTCTLEAHVVKCMAKGLAGDSYEASGNLTRGRWAGPSPEARGLKREL